MSSPDRSPAAGRNAALRAALRAAWPGLRISVRNGKDGAAAITWTDGPTEDAVQAVTRTVPAGTDGRPWAVLCTRTHTPALIAVSYLRARAAGRDDYLREWDTDDQPVPAGELRPMIGMRAEWKLPVHQLDAADVTAAEWRAAEAVLAVAEPHTTTKPGRVALYLARAVRHRGHVIDALTADA